MGRGQQQDVPRNDKHNVPCNNKGDAAHRKAAGVTSSIKPAASAQPNTAGTGKKNKKSMQPEETPKPNNGAHCCCSSTSSVTLCSRLPLLRLFTDQRAKKRKKSNVNSDDETEDVQQPMRKRVAFEQSYNDGVSLLLI